MNIEWVEEHRAGVVRFLTKMVGANDAEDVFQDVCVSLLDVPDETLSDNPVQRGIWLYRVAKNRALNHLRQRAR